jgi:hypothetical protein
VTASGLPLERAAGGARRARRARRAGPVPRGFIPWPGSSSSGSSAPGPRRAAAGWLVLPAGGCPLAAAPGAPGAAAVRLAVGPVASPPRRAGVAAAGPVGAAGGSVAAAGRSVAAAGGSVVAAGRSVAAAGGSVVAAGGSVVAAGGSVAAAVRGSVAAAGRGSSPPGSAGPGRLLAVTPVWIPWASSSTRMLVVAATVAIFSGLSRAASPCVASRPGGPAGASSRGGPAAGGARSAGPRRVRPAARPGSAVGLRTGPPRCWWAAACSLVLARRRRPRLPGWATSGRGRASIWS